MKTVEVVVLPGKKQALEMHPMGERPRLENYLPMYIGVDYLFDLIRYEFRASTLRIFEIKNAVHLSKQQNPKRYTYPWMNPLIEVGNTYKAEILNEKYNTCSLIMRD